ncbi:uncharacterized protein LOC115331375 [Ixodes scapularis]|uniref:uncharacterized protein LOC115331375 n=1 Tax=Ixodes scapularis TaxID=6945 RepID=UPI001C3800F2|nr:uncharacterized protein LOC115331375 [Ixodes scapularis]
MTYSNAVFAKQRRDVQLMDAELRPVGNDAPLGFGSLVSTDCQTMGILRLQPGVAKSTSKSLDHDVILLATDNTVLVKGTSTWQLLTKNSCCHISKGVPYSVMNISHAPAEVCFIVGGPC